MNKKLIAISCMAKTWTPCGQINHCMIYRSAILVAQMATLLVLGCDDILAPNDSDRRREAKEESERLEREAIRARKEKDELAATIETAVAGKKKITEERLAECEVERNVLRGDLDSLSKAIAEAMDRRLKSGEEAKAEVKALNVLKDETVNGLAVKYLGGDFAAYREKFILQVREGRAEEARYRKAIEDADSTYSSALSNAKEWNGKARDLRDSEISRLRREIASLESQRGSVRKDVSNLTKHKMIGNLRQERERREKGVVLQNKMEDIESEIRKKRRQLDFLSNPDNSSDTEYRASSRAQSTQSTADSQHRRRLEDIERTMKPKRSVADIVSECESSTFEKLRETMVARIAAVDKDVSECHKKIVALDAIQTSIPLATVQDLNTFRKRLLDL
ncbi:MAG: hypothetical protein II840_12500 [Kiritimatiellae bacterium]|nr:hypothetical protein [Kiritimatiellia bacterium]